MFWNALECREGLKLPSVENQLFRVFINKKGIFGGFYKEKGQKGSM